MHITCGSAVAFRTARDFIVLLRMAHSLKLISCHLFLFNILDHSWSWVTETAENKTTDKQDGGGGCYCIFVLIAYPYDEILTVCICLCTICISVLDTRKEWFYCLPQELTFVPWGLYGPTEKMKGQTRRLRWLCQLKSNPDSVRRDYSKGQQGEMDCFLF